MAYLIAFVIAVIDQLLKLLIDNLFYHGQTLPVVKDVFHLTYVKNTGAAFGILQDHQSFFIIITLVILAGIIIFIKNEKEGTIWFKLGIGILLGGTIGNLIDRLRFGYVIDYLDFRVWPVFNLADSAVVIGAGILLLYLLKGEDFIGG